MAGSALLIKKLLKELDRNNKNNEIYLTDCIELAKTEGLSSTYLTCDPTEALGIIRLSNSPMLRKDFNRQHGMCFE